MSRSVSNPSLAATSTAREVQKLAGIKDKVSNPNVIIDYHPPYVASKKGGISRHEAEAIIKRGDGKPQKYGIKKVPEPKKIIPRQQGRIHLNGPETVHSMVPLSIKGMRWDTKKRVYDENGNRRYDLISGAYEQKELFGALRSYGGEQSRTFSHGELILASNKSVEREIREGPSGLHICDEWEKKIMKTQGRPNKMISFREAFTLHPSSNAYNGQNFVWEYDAKQKIKAATGKSLIKSGLGGGHLFKKSTGEKVPKLDFAPLS